MKHIRIGTRSSKLALWQANFVAGKLLAAGWNTEIVTIDTRGDRILDVSIHKIGSKGVFTDEIEEKLRKGEIDIAVHSAKDLQSSLPDDMEIVAFTEREKAVDVLVADSPPDLTRHLRIGTSSTRRIALLHKYFPGVEAVPVRGNLQTRLGKMRDGDCDALMLAYAGVHRMGFNDAIVHEFPVEEFTPPVGQGTVAVESRNSLDMEIRRALREHVNHEGTEKRVRAERAFLKRLEGGCSIPAFCHALADGDKIRLMAGLSSLDGSKVLREEMTCPASEGERAGDELAQRILSQGGERLLREIRNEID